MRRSEAGPPLVAVAAIGILAGCGSKEPLSPFASNDPAGFLFAPDRVVEIALEIDPGDWDALRRQTRTWADIVAAPNRNCMTKPFTKPFTWFPASVTVDGIPREGVAVRKKGFHGSLHAERPALKLRFDAVDSEQTLYGLKRLTLNNAVQDPTWLRQCLSYEVFARAGVPAPWCNFAHLTVNGRDLGLYVHLESIDRRWVRRHFERDEGDLWEGELSDFRLEWIGSFEKEGDVADQTEVDRSSLEALARAVTRGNWLEELEQRIDLDEFLRFWAVEKILEHWDGYANSANNYFVYRDPADDRFVFAPWGTDQITVPDPWEPVHPPVSVYAGGILAHRLYMGSTATRQRYAETLRRMLDIAFVEDELLADIDRMQALVRPVLARAGADLEAQAGAVAELRDWVAGRRAALLADLAAGPPDWRQDPAPSSCIDLPGTLEGSFATTFGSNTAPDIFRTGTGTLLGSYRGRPLDVLSLGAWAGYDRNTPDDPWVVIDLNGRSRDGTYYNVWIGINPARFHSGSAGIFDSAYAWGGLGNWSPSTGQWTYMGSFDGGSIELHAAGLQPGAPVSGRFQSKVILW